VSAFHADPLVVGRCGTDWRRSAPTRADLCVSALRITR